MQILPAGFRVVQKFQIVQKVNYFKRVFGKLPSFFLFQTNLQKKNSIKNSNHVFWFVVRSDRQKWIDCFLKIDPKIRKQINSEFGALNISKLKILKEYDWLLE